MNNHQTDSSVASIEEIIDLETFSKENKIPRCNKKYRVRIDHEYFVFEHQVVTGKEILEKAYKLPVECHSLYQKFKNCDFTKIDLNEKVDLAKLGIEHFVVKPPEVFFYSVDDEPETTDQKALTPNQILELADIKPVSDYYIVQIKPDGTQISYKDKPDTPIHMECPAMKFISVFRGETPVS